MIATLTWFETGADPRRFREPDNRREVLERILRTAAAKTRYGRGLAVEELMECPEFPARMAVVSLQDFLCRRDRYSIASHGLRRPERLFYPLGKPPRTAVSGVPIRETMRVRAFRSLRSEELWDFAPQALAAPLDALRMLSATRPPPRRPIENAVIAFTSILTGPMTAEDASLLWNCFEVPVFEQLTGFDGELLAAECEMQQGLHIAGQSAHFELSDENRLIVSFLDNPRLPLLRLDTSFTAEIDEAPCACGLPSPRLRNLRRDKRMATGSLAALAHATGC